MENLFSTEDYFLLIVAVVIAINESVLLWLIPKIRQGVIDKHKAITCLCVFEVVIWFAAIAADTLIDKFYLGRNGWEINWITVGFIMVISFVSLLRYHEVLNEVELDEIKNP
jgi:hypothetical protein